MASRPRVRDEQVNQRARLLLDGQSMIQSLLSGTAPQPSLRVRQIML